jgi:O-antigen ligase
MGDTTARSFFRDYRAWMLGLLIVLLPLVFRFSPVPVIGTYTGSKLQLLEVAFLILFPLFVIITVKREGVSFRIPPAVIPLGLFIIAAFISAVLSVNPTRSLLDVAAFLYLSLLYFLFYNLIEEKRVLFALRLFVSVAVVIALIGLGGYLAYRCFGIESFAVEVYHQYLGIELIRARATMHTSNYLLVYLGFSLVTALSLLKIDDNRWFRRLSVVLVLLTVATITSGIYRGSFVIWGLLFFALAEFREIKWARAFRWVVLPLFLLFAALFVCQGYINISPVEVSHNEKTHTLDVSISTKPTVYANIHRAAVLIAKDHPVVGVGPGLYNEYMNMPEYEFDFDSYPWPSLDPHSTYLGFLAETGIVGVICLVLFFAPICVQVWRRRKKPGDESFVARFFWIYLVLMLFYAVFLDIVTLKFLYFGYALVFAGIPMEEEKPD